MEKTLYISDLDGTLLTPDSFVSDSSAAILSGLSAHGCLFSVATARTPATVVPLLAGIDSAVPLVVMTGAALWDRTRGCYINPRFIPENELSFILKTFSEAGISPFVYALWQDPDDMLNVFHPVEMTKAENEFYMLRRGLALKRFHLGEELPTGLRGRVLLVFGMDIHGKISTAAENLRGAGISSFSAYPDIFRKDLSLIEVFAPGVSKASAILNLKEMTGADRIVVFGDNLNDLPMFRIADRAVAVGNALREVRDKADIVIGKNSEDAVARFILSDFGERGQG